MVCAIVGGYCEHIEDLSIDDAPRQVWTDVQAAEVVRAYQSATEAAGRSFGYTPYTQLRQLCVAMCWCAPAVWHALLSLLKHAEQVRYVSHVASDDPLVVSALSYLPALTAVSSKCSWPQSVITFAERRFEQGWSNYALREPNHFRKPTLDLTDRVNEQETDLQLSLRPPSNLFAACQLSLSDGHRAVVARWAAGDFRAGDEQLTAAESDPTSEGVERSEDEMNVEREDEDGRADSRKQRCQQP